MKKKVINICINCKYYKKEIGWDFCYHPKSKQESFTNIITGKIVPEIYIIYRKLPPKTVSGSVTRTHRCKAVVIQGFCGYEGSYYEEKN